MNWVAKILLKESAIKESSRWQLSAREVVDKLKSFGFQLEACSSGHCKFSKPGLPCKPTVPVAHGSKSIPIGTLRQIARCAGLTSDQFLRQ